MIAVVIFFEEPGKESATRERARQFESLWKQWAPPVRLVILKSQYQSLVRPLLRFTNTLEQKSAERVVVLIPEVAPEGIGARLLHNHLGASLTAALRRRTDVVIGTVPIHLTASLGDKRKGPTGKWLGNPPAEHLTGGNISARHPDALSTHPAHAQNQQRSDEKIGKGNDK